MANMRRQSLALLLALAVPISAIAGGSFLDVEVKEFVRTSESEYRMIVAPTQRIKRSRPDPYMGKCPLLTVIGTYRKVDGAPTREEHIAALSRLESAYKENRNVNFGWMGQGLWVIDAAKPCEVQSRALGIRVGGDGETAVLSYYAKT